MRNMNFSRCSSVYHNILTFKDISLRSVRCVSILAIGCRDPVSTALLTKRGVQHCYFQKCSFCTTGTCWKRQATNKTWKLNITKSLDIGAEQECMQKDIQNCCEIGTEAITHDAVATRLKACLTVEEQMNELCSLLSLTPEDLENRRNFCQSLFHLFRPYFPNLRIHQFGSSVNGLGFKGCDIDISMNVNGVLDNEEMRKIAIPKEVFKIPLVEEVKSGAVPCEVLEKLPFKLLLRFVRRVLRQQCDEIKGSVLLISAKCPILRFYNEKYNLFCDLSLENAFSQSNSKVLCLLGRMDDRIIPFLKFLRYWGKNAGFVGDLEMFNSYSFSLLILYFLQNTSPPVVPPLSEIIAKSDYLAGDIENIDLLCNDLKKFSSSKNTQSIEELLREFFFYFMYVDFSRVLCPMTGSSIPKWEYKPSGGTFQFSTITVEDPFRTSFNTTAVANEKFCRIFLRHVLAACQIYQNKNAWVPNCDGWGLQLLLQKYDTMIFDTAESCSIEVPLKTSYLLQTNNLSRKTWQQKISQAILDALEYGLLFDCTVIKNSQTFVYEHVEPEKSKPHVMCSPILKVKCKVNHNVFSGRSNFKNLYLHESDNLLEVEHKISLNVSKSKKEDRTQTLFTFLCACEELRRDDSISLLMNLTFPKLVQPQLQPVVAVFLTEYLPKVLSYLIDKTDNDVDIKAERVLACNSES